MEIDLAKVDTVIEKCGKEPSSAISVLRHIQAEYNYLPREALEKVSHKLEVPLSRLYSIATFFKTFSLKPRGRHLIKLCMGTACHVRQSPRILAKIQRDLNVEPGEMTSDGMFTLETVNCLGACALGPLMVVDEEYHGNMTVSKVGPILKTYEES